MLGDKKNKKIKKFVQVFFFAGILRKKNLASEQQVSKLEEGRRTKWGVS